MRSIREFLTPWLARWRALRDLPQLLRAMDARLSALESGETAACQRLDWVESGLVAHNHRLDALEPGLAQGLRRADALEAGLAQGLRRTDALEHAAEHLRWRLDGLDPLLQMLPPANLAFAWQAPAPQWLGRAEARVGTSVAQLDDESRRKAFYTYYSEMGGDHRAILLQQYQAYLPFIGQAWRQCNQEALQASTPPSNPVLDIGCGAGELLSFLRANGIAALGIDLSATEVQRCTQAGLTALQANAADFLRQTDQRFCAISLLQVIEHVPPADVLPILEACVHRLSPGGLLLVETVNLRHALALNGFYTDPTHLTPIADNYMAFLMQWLGLKDVGVLYTLPEPVAPQMGTDPAAHYANYAVFGFRL